MSGIVSPVLPDLPVSSILPELAETLKRSGKAVLCAPPGSGKTTLVPPFMLEHEPGKILMLEPRRLAARAAAERIAEILHSRTGELAGYRVRGESCVNEDTRVEVVTEGILTRMLQKDPELSGRSLLIFDEFHERHLDGDLALALALDAAAGLRPDLQILVMSATLDADRISRLLGNAPVIRCEGTLFPVTEHWGEGFGDIRQAGIRAAGMVSRVLQTAPGDILVFLPGAKEIRDAAEQLAPIASDRLRIEPLYGSMDFKSQQSAIFPAPPGCRKVVLATNIAESSLTIEGIRVVIDSGVERIARFDPACGMTKLVTERASASSMIQRAGRAGRLGPGVVYRFCTESEFLRAEPFRTPEIAVCDLTGPALELACWGAVPQELKWLDPPPEPAWNEGRKLLQMLGALDQAGALTATGRAMNEYPAHPRLAAMMLEAKKRRLQSLGAELAALVSERDPVNDPDNSDLRERLDRFRKQPRRFPNLLTARDAILAAARSRYEVEIDEDAALLLAKAFPDRIGKKRGNGFLLTGGRGAVFSEHDPLKLQEWIVAPVLDGGGANARIRLALPIRESDVRENFSAVTTETVRLENDRVTAFREERIGAVVLNTVRLAAPDPEAAAALLAEVICQRGENILNLSGDAAGLLLRLRFARKFQPDAWPDPVDHWREILVMTGCRSVEELKRTNWYDILRQWLGFQTTARLDEEYPERFLTPAGSRLRIDYSGEKPVLEVKVQELYGLKKHPVLAGGKLPLILTLLSPAGRPIQVTGDLAGFWQGSWELVRKEMRGRYPKHIWPEDPANAQPTTRAKPRK